MLEICEDGYYIGYYDSFLRDLHSPERKLLIANLSSVHSLGNQQFLLQSVWNCWNGFVFFVDFSKDCLSYFNNFLQELEQKNIQLTPIQQEYARCYRELLRKLKK